jgi:hypothetical protein
MSNSNSSGSPATDGFDFIKKMWGGFSLPASMTPTADLDELDKRIKDLKAVEQWLNVNMSMLRTTIQGLEVQRGTIAMLKSFGNSMSLSPNDTEKPKTAPAKSSSSKPAADAKPATDASLKVGEATDSFLSNASAWWTVLQDQFNSVAQAALATGTDAVKRTADEVQNQAQAQSEAVAKASAAVKGAASSSKSKSTETAAKKTKITRPGTSK